MCGGSAEVGRLIIPLSGLARRHCPLLSLSSSPFLFLQSPSDWQGWPQLHSMLFVVLIAPSLFRSWEHQPLCSLMSPTLASEPDRQETKSLHVWLCLALWRLCSSNNPIIVPYLLMYFQQEAHHIHDFSLLSVNLLLSNLWLTLWPDGQFHSMFRLFKEFQRKLNK